MMLSDVIEKKTAPQTQEELLERCQAIAGLSFAQLSELTGAVIPNQAGQRKGWLGQVIEFALGTTAGNHALPDFHQLGIELKTLPISYSAKPTESTFVTSIPLLTIHQESWETSQCYKKLKRVLWLPVEGERDIPYMNRRIGLGFLWSPDQNQLQVLESDWYYLTNKISLGQLEEVDARFGEYLQIRPKAANAKSLAWAFDAEGRKVQTLPRGFYLRSSFTAEIYNASTNKMSIRD